VPLEAEHVGDDARPLFALLHGLGDAERSPGSAR
jgi:hypothetical protein